MIIHISYYYIILLLGESKVLCGECEGIHVLVIN